MTVARRPFLRSIAVASAALALAAPAIAAASTPPAPASIDLGDPSVLSQRGQRLALALPYGSAPGEPVSVSRFEVVSVKAPEGWAAPDPAGFSFAKPPRRNVVYLRSRETVDAPELTVTVRVAEQPDSLQTWTIGVPPARASATAAPAMTPVSARAAPAERAARRAPARERSSAR
jgi:hypothetical protein